MTIHAVSDEAPRTSSLRPPGRPVQVKDDTASVYDTTWTEQPDTQAAKGLNRIMGADGKIYVVLAVVLIIWFGLIALLVRTDRKIDRLEERLEMRESEAPE